MYLREALKTRWLWTSWCESLINFVTDFQMLVNCCRLLFFCFLLKNYSLAPLISCNRSEFSTSSRFSLKVDIFIPQKSLPTSKITASKSSTYSYSCTFLTLLSIRISRSFFTYILRRAHFHKGSHPPFYSRLTHVQICQRLQVSAPH